MRRLAVGDEWDEVKAALRKDLQDAHGELSDELERQARETVRLVRESAGELGSRVLQALEYAGTLWKEAIPENPLATLETRLALEDEQRARGLLRRWVRKDFLVDPELPEAMHPLALDDAAVWRIEVHERREARSWGEATAHYTGEPVPPPGPTQLLWEYSFPQPEIEVGERRERLAETAVLGACLACEGTGHRNCGECEGKGFVQCPACHGRARITCRRCRGRGRIADPKAERKARAHKSYFQVHAERLATDAADRLADFSERLRQEYGVPLPPSARWAPLAPASGETIPCPDCENGTIPCTCREGKLVCKSCRGSGLVTCQDCDGTGRVIRYREIVRRFDTRVTTSVAPNQPGAEWITDEMLRRAGGLEAWSGEVAGLSAAPPVNVPAAVWMAAREVALDAPTTEEPAGPSGDSERHVTHRRIRLTRVPATRLTYAYGGRRFVVVAVGNGRGERFWADEFPPRWSHVGRFFRTLVRDLNGEHLDRPARANGTLHRLDDYRGGKPELPRVRIVEDDAEEAANPAEGSAEPEGKD
jgi:hypothetical protein